MSPWGLAWRGMVRQPARAILGVAGVAIVGALLLDMLLLSRGLTISFGELLDSVGYDVRVTATDAPPGSGVPLSDVSTTLDRIIALAEVGDAVALRFGRARHERAPKVNVMGTASRAQNNWRLVAGRELIDGAGEPELLVNPAFVERAELVIGRTIKLRGRCSEASNVLPEVRFLVVGIVEPRFDAPGDLSAITTLGAFEELCGGLDLDTADILLAAASGDSTPGRAVEAIMREIPSLHAFSNEQLLTRLQTRDFSYFRQISFVLSSLTMLFAFLLIATLLTVSVNRRLAEVAALRALGFSRRRVIMDLLAESALLVGAGGLLSWPLGGLLAVWLDSILRGMGGIPNELHFFVFQGRAIAVHAAALLATAVAAAAYPVVLAARLPIAATLRKEVVS